MHVPINCPDRPERHGCQPLPPQTTTSIRIRSQTSLRSMRKTIAWITSN